MKFTLRIIPIILLTIFGCTTTGISKKDINLYYIYYDLSCKPLAGNSINCTVIFDIDEDYTMNEPKIILFLYDVMYQVSNYGIEQGYKFGRIIDWKVKLNKLIPGNENSFSFEFSKSVSKENIMGYSYHLGEKYFVLDDAVKMKEYWDKKYEKNNQGKDRLSIRDPYIHEETEISFKYLYNKFKRKDIWGIDIINYNSNHISELCSKIFQEDSNIKTLLPTWVRIFIQKPDENYSPLKQALLEIGKLTNQEELIFYKLESLEIKGSEIPLISYSILNKDTKNIVDKRIFVYKNYRFIIKAEYRDGFRTCNQQSFEEFVHEVFN